MDVLVLAQESALGAFFGFQSPARKRRGIAGSEFKRIAQRAWTDAAGRSVRSEDRSNTASGAYVRTVS